MSTSPRPATPTSTFFVKRQRGVVRGGWVIITLAPNNTPSRSLLRQQQQRQCREYDDGAVMESNECQSRTSDGPSRHDKSLSWWRPRRCRSGNDCGWQNGTSTTDRWYLAPCLVVVLLPRITDDDDDDDDGAVTVCLACQAYTINRHGGPTTLDFPSRGL